MKQTDVFIDLEGLGIPQGLKKSIRTISFLQERLGLALEKHGYALKSVTGFARYRNPRNQITPYVQQAITRAFEHRSWKMVWSPGIADIAMMDDIKSRIVSDLSDVVMLITNDHDFIKIVIHLRDNGKLVLVSGPLTNRRLEKIADKSWSLWDLLGGHPDGLDDDSSRYMAGGSIPNGIPL